MANYSGPLNEKIAIPKPDKRTILGRREDGLDVPEVVDQMRAKMTLLFGNYGIPENDPNAWQRLAVELALAHVAGFQIDNRKPGRHVEWTLDQYLDLVAKVDSARSLPGRKPRTKEKAYEVVAKSRGQTKAAIKKQYQLGMAEISAKSAREKTAEIERAAREKFGHLVWTPYGPIRVLHPVPTVLTGKDT